MRAEKNSQHLRDQTHQPAQVNMSSLICGIQHINLRYGTFACQCNQFRCFSSSPQSETESYIDATNFIVSLAFGATSAVRSLFGY